MVGCLTSQQHASVSQGRICLDKFTCCHTEIEVADQTFHFTQSQYTDTGPTSPSTDPITPDAWQGSHWSAKFLSHWYDSTPAQAGFEPGIFRSRGGRLNHWANEAVQTLDWNPQRKRRVGRLKKTWGRLNEKEMKTCGDNMECSQEGDVESSALESCC